MDMTLEIEAVYQRALLLRQRATEVPVNPPLLEEALKALYFVLEELQATQAELRHQNQDLLATRRSVERERQRYQVLFELAPEGYLVTNRQGTIHQANRAAANLFAIPQEYLIDKPLMLLIDQADRAMFQQRLVNLHQTQDWELALTPHDGQPRSVAIAVTHIKGGRKEEDTLLWSIHDITQRRQMEQQLEYINEQLAHRVEQRTVELSATTIQLHQTIAQQQQSAQTIAQQATQMAQAQEVESLGKLASGIAHDLNNVLTPILAIAQLLLYKPESLSQQSREMLQMIVDSAKRGADLITQILTFSQAKKPNQSLALPIEPILAEVTQLIQQTFPQSIAIQYDRPLPTLNLIAAEPSPIHQILMNLCVNARDAMPDGGILTLTAENCQLDHADHGGNYVVIKVTDTGSGMPPEIMAKIFDPFFTTKKLGEGNGLGLAIVFKIAKNYGGFVEVSSQLGQGSQFQVYLPALEAIAPAIGEFDTMPAGNGELILIVDDEPTVRQITQTICETYHYKTLVASDGAAAIALYHQYPDQISAVIIDMMMPNIDGLTALQVLKQINPQVPIIAVSGVPTNQALAIAAGANMFLAKPYTPQAILTLLRDLLQAT
jgi:PAS domain S-box-containing protein